MKESPFLSTLCPSHHEKTEHARSAVRQVLTGMAVTLCVLVVSAGITSAGFRKAGEAWTHRMIFSDRRVVAQKKHAEFLKAQIRMFRRMHGDPAQWTWERKDEYDRLTVQAREAVRAYNALAPIGETMPFPDTSLPYAVLKD